MTRERLLNLSRRISAIERDVLPLERHGYGVLLGLEAAQAALAKQLDRLDELEAREP